jgi:hypothetical protein
MIAWLLSLINLTALHLENRKLRDELCRLNAERYARNATAAGLTPTRKRDYN